MIGRNFRVMRAAQAAGLVTALCCGVNLAPAAAADIDYGKLFLEHALKCLHPTANPDKATVEIAKGPETKGDISTVRLKVFYSGLIKKHAMDADLMIRQAGSIRQMKVNVLSDTGAEVSRCDLTKNWADF
jgi:hypothetical protein